MDFVRANFSHKQLLGALELYPLDLENVAITRLTGIANDNYRVAGTNLDVALKVYSHGQADEKKIRKELDAQQLFRNSGIKVPELLSGIDGNVLQKHEGFCICVTKFVSGTVFDEVSFTKGRMYEVGKLVGRVEEVSKRLDISKFECMSLLEEYDYVGKNLSGEMKKRGYDFDLNLYNKNVKLVRDIAGKLDRCRNPQFLHKDIWPWNLIEGADGIYLLDFNDWAVSAPIIELSVPLVEFSMFKSGEFDYDVAENILNGYKNVKTMKYSARELWEAMVFICYLYFPYNVIQADDPFESEVYLKRIDTLMKNPDMLVAIV